MSQQAQVAANKEEDATTMSHAETAATANTTAITAEDHQRFQESVAATRADIARSQASIARGQANIDRSLSACDSFENKWKEFQDRFDELTRALVDRMTPAISQQLGIPRCCFDGDEAALTNEDKRAVFDGAPTLEAILDGIKCGKYHRIVVACGAGMSTSAGIPDFRSPGTGLYSQMENEYKHQQQLAALVRETAGTGVGSAITTQPKAQAANETAQSSTASSSQQQQEEQARLAKLTEAELAAEVNEKLNVDYYRRNPVPFLDRMAGMWPNPKGQEQKFKPTPSHVFLAILHHHYRALKRVYTQNIDGLELSVGLPTDMVVQCHGSFDVVKCTDCDFELSSSSSCDNGSLTYEKARQLMCNKQPVQCPKCAKFLQPAIVMFGQPLPQRFSEQWRNDSNVCDLLIVVGTSLKVYPFAGIPNDVSRKTPRLLINNELVGDFAHTCAGAAKNKAKETTSSILPAESSGSGSNNYRDVAVVKRSDDVFYDMAEYLGIKTLFTSQCAATGCKAARPPQQQQQQETTKTVSGSTEKGGGKGGQETTATLLTRQKKKEHMLPSTKPTAERQTQRSNATTGTTYSHRCGARSRSNSQKPRSGSLKRKSSVSGRGSGNHQGKKT